MAGERNARWSLARAKPTHIPFYARGRMPVAREPERRSRIFSLDDNLFVRRRDINAQATQELDPRKKEVQSLGWKKRFIPLSARRSLVSWRKTIQYNISFEWVHRSSTNLTQQELTIYRITSLSMKTPVRITVELRSTLGIGNFKMSTFKPGFYIGVYLTCISSNTSAIKRLHHSK